MMDEKMGNSALDNLNNLKVTLGHTGAQEGIAKIRFITSSAL
jgi:hypothetical protein